LLNLRRGATSGAFSTFRVSEWSVRRKVVAVLAIPVILACVFGGLRVSTELRAANDYSTNQQRATVLGPAVEYLAATERLALPSSLAGAMGGGNANDAYKTAEGNLKRSAAGAALDATQTGYVTSMTQIGDTLANGSGTGITATAPVQLSDMTRLSSELISSTLNTQGTPDPHVQALIQTLNARLSLVKQQLLIQSDAQESTLLGSVWLAAEIGVEGAALDNLKGLVGGHRLSKLAAANGTRLGLATNSKVTALTATPEDFTTYDGLSLRLLTNIDDELASNASASKQRALEDAGIILLAILASLVLALLVARALIVPLRKVRAGALEVAHEKLPDTVAKIRDGKEPEEFAPIPVHSHEELGQLARAVDDMHRQAVNLATGEAQLRAQVGAMFVTLSRRNTTLVNQQLALIESLEQDEEDPQRLEQLFSLDHLATRMRRTAESLVILGGTSGRQASFEELSVSDVIHAAVSEVQDYQRVRIDAAPDRMISGRAASDVVHLMAELIDNALSYSPPGSPVTIQAAEENGKVEIEIIDTGLGMAGDALAQANESLKKGGEVTIDTARRMGLFVVSRLAEEHGLQVKLGRNTNGGGIIATIVLPHGVLVSDEPVAHVSILDAPAEAEPETPVVDDEPAEEYDPYLERIEEAIAAVTGLPRRRPGLATNEPVPTPAAAVSMFEAAPTADSPEVLAALEPTPVASLNDSDRPSDIVAESLSDWRERESADVIALPAGEPERLANVVTPQFGADRGDPLTDAWVDEDLAEPEHETAAHEDEHEHVAAEWHQGAWEEPVTEPAPSEEVSWHESVPDHEPEPEHAEPEHIEQESAELPVEAHHDFHSVELSEPAASYDVPDPVEESAVEATAVEEPVVDEPVAELPVAEAPPVEEPSAFRLQIRRPLSAAPAAAALEGDFVGAADHAVDSPIFGQLQSNWLDGDGDSTWSADEVDRAWSAADRVESDADVDDTTPTGLPVRRPGGRLVPGGVSQEPAKVIRDPEAIRNRLAAHAAGVSRGRAAASGQPTNDDYAHEETGPA
jgi:signal transduction histidine kinase